MFILSLIWLLSTFQQHSIKQCTCSQLLTERDCIKNISLKCSWDNQKKICFKSNDSLPISITSYCNSFDIKICQNTDGCAWVDNQCSFFTGCTPFSKTTDTDCQTISNRCITDGTHCVEIDDCNTYHKQITCIRDVRNKLCYWDAQNSKCFDADSCDKLPKLYKSDHECRNQIKICTTTADGGCVESGENCSDQKLQISCVWNKIQTIGCFWDGILCKDKICDNAPSTLTTNNDCEKFQQGCITKSNGGCVQNGACSVANIQDACIKNKNNIDCFWIETCIEKTCNNAPLKYNTHDLCQNFLSQCTVKEGGGCQNKTCLNAPQNLETNDGCENYLPENNCITKIRGGCIKNTTCNAIDLEIACVKDSNGQDCFWDSKSRNCKLKACVNASSDNNTHDLCQQFSLRCTVNSKNTGCIEKTCENSLSQQICDKDIKNQQCIWKDKCYKKQCVFASLTIKTHLECQEYLSSCTLSNTGSGCAIIPLKCEAITIQEGCQIKAGGLLCGWTGSECIDKSCLTAPKTLDTTLKCQKYLPNCVSYQPFNGCQDLPFTCASRKSSDNCEVRRTGFPTCLWVSSKISCIEKSCITANSQGTTGALFTFSFQNCQNYLNGCILNNTSDGCMVKPSSCSSLVQQNCQIGSKINGDCYWNGDNCVDRICSNINKSNHNDCQNTFDQCTVNNEGTSCQQLETLCQNYQKQENCRFTQQNKNCIWTGSKCRNAICADAPQTTSYDNETECQAYQTISESCTVIYKDGSSGCVQKLSNCSDYMSQSQCHKTLTNLTENDDCKWVVDKCYSLSIFEKQSCSSFQGTKEMCEEYKQGCTNDNHASSQVNCILDCTLKKKTNVNLNFEDCQTLDPTCSVRKDGSNCIQMQNYCEGYGEKSENCYKSSREYCAMKQNSCISIAQASDCKSVTDSNRSLNHQKCQLYHYLCTSLNDGSGCQEYKQTCQAYSDQQNNCTISFEGKCYFNQVTCVRFSMCSSIMITLEESVQKLNNGNQMCQQYHKDCTTNLNGTTCQERKDTCMDYWNDQNACTFSKSTYICYWTGSKCINVDNPSTDCAKIQKNNYEYLTDTKCASYHSDCTCNQSGDSCQEKKATCDQYEQQVECSFSKSEPDKKCVWTGSKCIIVNNPSIDCAKIQQKNYGYLTDAKCASFHSNCTCNQSGDSCQEKKATCDQYKQQFECTYSISESFSYACNWTGEKCTFTLNDYINCDQIQYFYSFWLLSDEICASYHCSFNAWLGMCQQKKTTCDEYIESIECSFSESVTEKRCLWTGQECRPFLNVSSDCAKIKNVSFLYNLSDEICASYHEDCTVNSYLEKCQEKKPTCVEYQSYEECTFSKSDPPENICIWIDYECKSILNGSTDCANVKNTISLLLLTEKLCASFHTDCILNIFGDSCFEKKETCQEYKFKKECQFSKSMPPENICIWTGQECRPFLNVSTDCANIQNAVPSWILTEKICASYHTDCTINRLNNNCQEKKATCYEYQFEDECTSSKSTSERICHWEDVKCIPFIFVSTVCEKIRNDMNIQFLSDEICASYHANCTVNVFAQNCQEKKETCDQYQNWYQSQSMRFSEWLLLQSYLFLNDLFQPLRNCKKGLQKQTLINSHALTVMHKCQPFLNASSDCSYIPYQRLDEKLCASYNIDCTIDYYGFNCQYRQSTCYLYQNYECTFSKAAPPNDKCIWTGEQCRPFLNVSTDCANIKQIDFWDVLSDTKCASYHKNCTSLRDGTGCQEKKATCQDYTDLNQCVKQSDGKYCLWFENYCNIISGTSCNAIVGSKLNHFNCEEYNLSCTVNSEGTACQDFKQNCEQYAGTPLNCTRSFQSKCYLYNFEGSNYCITISDVRTDCQKIQGKNLTYETCQSYNIGCSVNRKKNACIEQKTDCSGYSSNMSNCYQSKSGLCVSHSKSDDYCISMSSVTGCNEIHLGQGNYNDANCNKFKSGCTVKQDGCIIRACENAQGFTIYNHINCNFWLNNCTVNKDNNNCIPMPQTCAHQTYPSCLYSMESDCEVINNVCIQKTCKTAKIDADFDSDSKCSTYLKECTVANKLAGCQPRDFCQFYKTLIQCKLNNRGEKCFWNPTFQSCVDLNCENIEDTSLYDSHNKCAAVDEALACTVRAQGKGCMSRGECSLYTIQQQCITNSKGEACVWNINDAIKPVCQNKSCKSAPNTTITHNDCYTYYNTNKITCTVSATLSGGSLTIGGCQETTNCNDYIAQEQCQINANGDLCGWNGKQCADKSCATAPADYDDDQKCRAYFNNKCTVSQTGQGCVDIPIICEQMTQEKQCYFNQAGDPCYWTGTICITRSCENAPDVTTADQCNAYLVGCTLDDIKCKATVCEDFEFNTDVLCMLVLPTCTTNGNNCVTRGSCLQALNKAGCVISSTGQQCEWIPEVLNAQNQITQQAYCTIKNCSTAPIIFTNEAACAGYFKDCTTKNGGGCIAKSTCAAVSIDVACTTALNGTLCFWDNTQNKCRDKDCQDYSGTTHKVCFAQKQGCTAGANGKCEKIQNCEQTTIKAACIEGLNGPCLWIDQYENIDGTKGACFNYTSCKSLSWNNDTQCKWISDKCTTIGSNCIGITLCSETNTDGGCVTGYDGACIQSVPALNSPNPKICKPFTSCSDAFYITHTDCQIASKKCTTNGTTGCIEIGSCSSYVSEVSCKINNKGVIYSFGSIVSTGICTWDLTDNNCRDQSCADLIGTTHSICASQLSTCTSNGTTCLLRGACSSYTNLAACTAAIGNDGYCFWDNNQNAQCRLLSCPDIQNGTSDEICSSSLSTCISDGIACITKANCSSYKTENICKNGLDGICYWERGSIKNNDIPKCRLFLCTDIQNGRTIKNCQDISKSCISNGVYCIPKNNCSAYISKIACNFGGLDGICVFTQLTGLQTIPGIGTCALMKECEQANNDQNACQNAKDRCSWRSKTQKENIFIPSQCSPHTCTTNYETNGACTIIYDWEKTSQQICIFRQGYCKENDPSLLSLQECHLVSGFTYTWNDKDNKCEVCNPQGDNHNTIITSYSQLDLIEKIMVIIIFHLIF